MRTEDYKIGDKVEVLINNPRNDNKDEWRDAEVIKINTIYPSGSGNYTPYPMLIVRVIRTYCRVVANNYRMVDSIPIYVDCTLEYYDKINEEGIVNSNEIKLKQ